VIAAIWSKARPAYETGRNEYVDGYRDDEKDPDGRELKCNSDVQIGQGWDQRHPQPQDQRRNGGDRGPPVSQNQ